MCCRGNSPIQQGDRGGDIAPPRHREPIRQLFDTQVHTRLVNY